MNVDTFMNAVTAAFPIPADIFGRAKWMGEAADTAASLLRQCRKEEKMLLWRIQEGGLTSDVYTLKEFCRPHARVNIALLREREAELFEKIVHVRAADAVKVLSAKRLYALMADVLGDAVTEYEVVTVTDVCRHLPAAEAKQYIIDDEEFVKLAVVERER